ncbi:hypothetical protein MJO28_010145 [Puccinia striiformis f. sp. tritici]|uniref:Uncharacterized protein n=1 Tax=Puccinia striiformis f. sp. tritici TaxID=168172 RepID=A0ACC0E458_9BASI|nr:hypothetical protein MJO28_010145 [Puccinia striiformis f. sp. tritici]
MNPPTLTSCRITKGLVHRSSTPSNPTLPSQETANLLKSTSMDLGNCPRTMRSRGPNHIWAVIWNENMERLGISLYGVFDLWSRSILAMYAHKMPCDPIHVGIEFLQLAATSGGIPLMVITNDGIGTLDLARYQTQLAQSYGPAASMEASVHVHFIQSDTTLWITRSWSRINNQYIRPVMETIYQQIEAGKYNPEDSIQRLLFLFLWVPLIQTSLDHWATDINAPTTRVNQGREITVSNRHHAYLNPETFGAENEIIEVPEEDIEEILANNYSPWDFCHTTTPQWFHIRAMEILHMLDIQLDQLTLGGVWTVFDQMLPQVQGSFPTIIH